MTLDALGTMAPLTAPIVVLVGALFLLGIDLLLPHGDKRLLAGGTIAVLLAGIGATFLFDTQGEAWGGAYVCDPLGIFLQRVFYAGGIVAVLGSRQQVIEQFTRRQGEYYLLVMFSVLGMALLAGARDLVLLIVAFEMMSVPLYVLAAYAREDRKAVEGALKLFLVGAVSSATLLFGMSLLFGLASSTHIADVATYVAAHPSPLAALAVAFVLGGLGFKIGVFPFHMWVPDTYEGARTPFVAFLSATPKVAGLVALLQVLIPRGHALLSTVLPLLLVLAALTLIVGNFLAINQSNVKRLLAYSGVAHMGFLLTALATGTELGLGMLLFYAGAYLFTNMGAFLVVHAVSAGGGDDSIGSFDGMYRRNAWLGMAMLVFLLSLAGIPFVVGFWAKLYVFLAAWEAGLGWLVVLGAVLSVLALFYYLRVARAMFMNAPESDARIEVDLATNAGILLCLVAVVGLGVMPRPMFDAAQAAATAFFGG